MEKDRYFQEKEEGERSALLNPSDVISPVWEMYRNLSIIISFITP